MSIAVMERPVITKPEPAEWVQPAAVKDWLRSCPIVQPDMLCEELVELFRRNTELECAVVCDPSRRPLGLMMKHRFFRFLGSTFGMSLFASKQISHLMETGTLTAEVDVPARELIDRALSRSEETFYDAAIMTERGQFAGILTVSDLLHLSRMLQREAAERQIRTVRGADEMIGHIHRSFQNVEAATAETRSYSEKMTEVTGHGRQVMEEMLRLFRQWSDHAKQQEAAMAELNEGTAAANQIAKLIAELADRCNLLAVNAAIEAARAGAHGKGFGVVAGEIRELADGTKRSAGEINRRLQAMTEAVSRTVSLVEAGKQGADRGIEQVGSAEETFAELWDISAQNGKASRRLSEAAREAAATSNGIRTEIGRLMEQMNGSTML